jgi:hypothetical protein
MMAPPFRRPPSGSRGSSYRLRREAVERVLDALCWSQEGLAATIGVHRVTLSRAMCGRPVSRRLRRRFMECAVFQGLSPDDLWVRSDPDAE